MEQSTIETKAVDRAAWAPIAEVVHTLRLVFGVELTAVVAGVDEPTVDGWEAGARSPDPNAERRMRDALRVVDELGVQEAPHTIRAWFVGLNPELDDRPAALVIAEDPELVLDAARVFMAHG